VDRNRQRSRHAAVAGLLTASLRIALSGMRPQLVLVIGIVFFGCIYLGLVLALGLLAHDEKHVINRYTARYFRFSRLR
jgi:hypothetical protein